MLDLTKDGQDSDKGYWHGFIEFYAPFFESRDFKFIAEFGVLHGDSIRYFLNRFPNALVYGADILPLQLEWPIDERFHFSQLDQGVDDAVRKFLSQANFDLIIEDGSHHPQHQANCLMIGLDYLCLKIFIHLCQITHCILMKQL